MKIPKLKQKWIILIAVELVAIIGISVADYFLWKEAKNILREVSRQKLMALASSSAALVDPEKHEKIINKSDEKGRNYKKIQSTLGKITGSNPEIYDIYTIRKSQNGEVVWSYVVGVYDTYDKNQDGIIQPYERGIRVGEEINVANFPELQNAFYGPNADHNIHCNDRGCWLSGYAPVKDVHGESIAVLGVDISEQNVNNLEKTTLDKIKKALVFFSALFLLSIGLTVFLFSKERKDFENSNKQC